MTIAALKLRSADPVALQLFYLRTFDALGIEGGCRLGEERIAFAPAASARWRIRSSAKAVMNMIGMHLCRACSSL